MAAAATLPRAAAAPRRAAPAWIAWGLGAAAGLALCWLVFIVYATGRPLVALGLLVLGTAAIHAYAFASNPAWKYLFPGVAGMLVFVAFPLVYTAQIGFTNYSSNHLLDEARARAYLLDQRVIEEAGLLPYTMHREGDGVRLVLGPAEGSESPGAPAFASPVLRLAEGAPREPVPLLALAEGTRPAAPPLALPEVIALRAALAGLVLQVPGREDPLRYAGLREFGDVRPVWLPAEGGALKQATTGEVFTPNADTGYFTSAAGVTVTPGFTVGVGFANYERMLFDADFRGPFVAIFVWTVAFAGLTVLFSTALGLLLAVLLNWEALRFRTVYRTLLFLPYAVPGFISILVFKGLFNQNFGEINAILDWAFGVRPAWFADPWLARTMILIVNTWLGYPYIMVLATGLIKAIPSDLYEASALAGASPWVNFRRITAPLIVKPMTPLLIAAFAFNFNNFVLISLLTDGRPDFLDTKLPAGTTDILVSYTYRIAFTDAGQNFGLAGAISTLIFLLVAVMGVVQLKLAARAAKA
jgi:maltose/maltodextrin transport system permease protein